MQKPHMANRAAIADCEFRGRGCGFVGLRGGGLGTVAAAGWWWRATVPRPRLARSLNPPVRPLCRLPLLAICGPAMCGNAAHTPPAKCWERLHCRKAQVGIFNIEPQTSIQSLIRLLRVLASGMQTAFKLQIFLFCCIGIFTLSPNKTNSRFISGDHLNWPSEQLLLQKAQMSRKS